MKKYFSLSLLLAAFMMIGFTSCGGDKPPVDPPGPPATEAWTLLAAMYQGDMGSGQEGFNGYVFALASKGITISEAGIGGSGKLVFFTISGPAFQEGGVPTGTYTPANTLAKNTYIIGMTTPDGSPLSYLEEYENGQPVAAPKEINKGTLVIENNKITFKDGDFTINYEGDINVVDRQPKPFIDEPTEVTTMDYNFVQADMDNKTAHFYTFGDYYKNGTTNVLVAFADNAKTMVSQMEFLLAGNATEMQEGTYTINDTKGAGTMLASSGFDGKYHTPSFLAPYKDGLPTGVYFFSSGQATIAAGVLTVNATTHFGSTINFIYTGNLGLETLPQNAPKAMMMAR